MEKLVKMTAEMGETMEDDVKKVHKRIHDLMKEGNLHKVEEAFAMAIDDVDQTIFYDEDFLYIRSRIFRIITSDAKMRGSRLKAYLIVEGALRPEPARMYTCRMRLSMCCGEEKKRGIEFYRFSRVILDV